MNNQILSWVVFSFTIILLLALDLGVLNKKNKVVSLKKSIILTVFYIIIACLFGLYIYYNFGIQGAREYYTGFLLEKAMALDNIFVISIIFKFFHIPLKFQHRVLFWGIVGVIILRAIMIGVGASLIVNFNWILFVFGGILIITGIKTFILLEQEPVKIEETFIYKTLKKRLNIHPKLVGNKFFVIKNNKFFITPLFMALMIIEAMDLIFAIDSIPAIFAVTQNTYIVYTSNIFAILGLRALFFLLADIVERFKYIKYSLAIILIAIGIKIFIAHFVYIPTYVPLIITVGLLISGILVSVIISEKL